MALFLSIPKPPVDFMNILKHKADTDTHLEKVDLGVGLYRNEQGGYYEFPAIKKVYWVLGLVSRTREKGYMANVNDSRQKIY